jgi:hypothetical protein
MNDSAIGRDHGRPVIWDGLCGEPVAWLRIGEPVIGEYWAEHSPVSYTHLLSPAEAVEIYGPVTEITAGPGGGLQSVTYGETTFMTKELDPDGSEQWARRPAIAGIEYDRKVITVNDPDLEWPCPKCGAVPGKPCDGTSRKHRVRRAYGSRYEEMQREIAALRSEIAQLRKENDRLDEWLTALRKERDNPDPVCSRPTRAGTPCKANAIVYPVAIESCRIHLTAEEREMLDSKERHY